MCLLRGVEQDNGVIPGCEEGADPALAHRCGCRCEVISQHLQKEEQALALQMRKEVGFRPREGKGLSEAGVTGVGGGCVDRLTAGTLVLRLPLPVESSVSGRSQRWACIFKKT